MHVEPLDDEHGAALVVRLSRRAVDPGHPDLAVLVRQCDGLPVALKAAAARLRRQPGLTIPALTEEIALTGHDTLTAVFATSYGRLPPEQAAMFRCAGILPGPDFTNKIAAVATDTQPSECRRLLEELVEANLLDQAATGRFRLHGLLRRYARDRAHAEEGTAVAATQRRAAEHLLELAAYADLRVLGPLRFRCTDHETLLPDPNNPFADKGSALGWLDAERATLLATMHLAQQHGWHELGWQLAEAASALYVEHRYLVDWTESGELGAMAARLAGNPEAEARLRSFASRAWSDLGQLDRAHRELEIALPLAESATNPRLLASVWEMYGRYYDHQGDHGRAADAYRLAIELFASVPDRRGVAFVSMFFGLSQDAAGEPERALDTLRQAVELIREVDTGRMPGRALTALGQVASRLGRDKEARAALDEAVRVLQACGNTFYEAQAQEALADLVLRAGDRDGARASLTRQRDLFAELGSPDIAAVQQRLDALSLA